MSLIQPEQQSKEIAGGSDYRSFATGAQPQLWLNMGYRDPNRRGAPVKTSYFGVRETDEFAAERRRLFEVFGLEPKEVEIMLPSRLEDCLDIRYRVFLGGGEGKGSLRAYGLTNFATTGAPVRDVMHVMSNEAGEIVEVPIAAPDDPFAKQRVKQHLGPKAEIELSMVMKFGIPKVLGVGGVAAISSKGQRTFRNLWTSLAQLYALFGPQISFAIQPILFMREAHANYVDPKTKKWARSEFYALDIRTTETLEETFNRIKERKELLQGTAPASLPTSVGAADERDPSAAAALPHGGGEAAAPPPAEEEPEDAGEGEIVDEPVGREGEPEGQQVMDVKAAPGQFKALNDVLYTLKQARKVTDLIDTTSGEIVADAATLEQQAEASEVDPWVAYARAFTRHHFGLDGDQLANQLTAAQLQELIDHLSKLEIPF